MSAISTFRRTALRLAAGAAILASQAAPAQMFYADPDFRPGPISPGDPLVGIPLPGATAAEQRAGLLWNMRAGLNVAALQCQNWTYLRQVENYNSLLAHHSKELNDAFTTLGGYFKRLNGPVGGPKKFDDYTTSTYNNFSTLQAQMGFCQVAAAVTRDALQRPKGQLHVTAETRMREFRNSLAAASDRFSAYNPGAIRAPNLPLTDQCWDRNDQLKAECEGAVAR